MAINVVTIGADTVEVYAGSARLTSRANTSFGPAAKKWRSIVVADDKPRTLVSATRYVDDIPWAGTAIGVVGTDATTLQFPRSGGGITDTPEQQLALVEKCVMELAMQLALSPNILTSEDQSSNVKKLDADGTSIEFWGPTTVVDGTARRYPLALEPLLSRYLGSTTSGVVVPAVGFSSGTGGSSDFDDCDGTDRTEPF